MILLSPQRSDRRLFRLLTSSILSLFLLSVSKCGISCADTVAFKNGDKLTGEIVSEDDDAIILKTEAMGEVVIKRALAEKVEKADQKVLPPQEKKTSGEVATEWQRKVSLGYNISQGNTETEALSGGLTLNKKREKIDELTASAKASYSSSKKVMNAQKWNALGRYAVSFGDSKRWYDFFKYEVDHDRFANIFYRSVPSSGLGYWFFDDDEIRLMAEAAAGLEYTDFYDGTADTSRGVFVPRLLFERSLWFNSKITQNVYVYPVIRDISNYRLRSETTFTNRIFEGLALVISLIDDYNSKPTGASKKNDLQMKTSIAYSF